MSRRQYQRPHRSSGQPPDDTGCTILHVDMDAFYACASLLSHPQLVGQPVIIGGGDRGVVLSATYEARRYGVSAAMPMGRARRLCPQAHVIAPDYPRYTRISAAVMAVLGQITPLVEPLSLDEAFLDVAGVRRRFGSPAQIATLIRDTIADEQGLPCSVGVAPTKYVAKLASGLAKPDGLLVVPVTEVVTFVQQLPVGALWGVGERTEEHLHRLGLRTVADIAHTPVDTLRRALGEPGASLHALAWGRDERRVTPIRAERSVGADQTFAVDLDDPREIHRRLLRLAEKTASRARAQGVMGRTITIKVRFSDFSTITRSRTRRDPTDVTQEIYELARRLFDELGLQRARLRLVGVRLEGLIEAEEAPIQARLDEPEHGWRDADRAIDRASARFGAGAVRPAALVTSRSAAPASATKPPSAPSSPTSTGPPFTGSGARGRVP